VDAEGNTLIPFDPDQTYEEHEAVFLAAFAGTSREVRGQLQATRVGRDQKVVRQKGKSKGKGKARGTAKSRPFF